MVHGSGHALTWSLDFQLKDDAYATLTKPPHHKLFDLTKKKQVSPVIQHHIANENVSKDGLSAASVFNITLGNDFMNALHPPAPVAPLPLLPILQSFLCLTYYIPPGFQVLRWIFLWYVWSCITDYPEAERELLLSSSASQVHTGGWFQGYGCLYGRDCWSTGHCWEV